MFLLKKIISPFLFPLPLLLGIQLIGLMLLWFSRRQRLGKIMVSVGSVMLLLCSYGLFSDLLLRGLERHYPAMISRGAVGPSGMPARFKWIVVLGGGHTSDPDLPVTSQLSRSSLVRVIEAVRLYREYPGCRIIVSGGAVFGTVSEAETMKQLAVSLGVPAESLELEADSRDTEEEARLIRPMVGSDPFILVTSASHMPRSMALFRKEGMNPVPAPTEHLVKEGPEGTRTPPSAFFPSPDGLEKATDAFYEYLGLAWAMLRGKI